MHQYEGTLFFIQLYISCLCFLVSNSCFLSHLSSPIQDWKFSSCCWTDLPRHPPVVFLVSNSCFFPRESNAWKELSRSIHKTILFSFFQSPLKCSLLSRCPQPGIVTISCHVKYFITLLWSPLCTHMSSHDLDSLCLEQSLYFSSVFEQLLKKWNPYLLLQLYIDMRKQNYLIY